jgi:hypothetical protein
VRGEQFICSASPSSPGAACSWAASNWRIRDSQVWRPVNSRFCLRQRSAIAWWVMVSASGSGYSSQLLGKGERIVRCIKQARAIETVPVAGVVIRLAVGKARGEQWQRLAEQVFTNDLERDKAQLAY